MVGNNSSKVGIRSGRGKALPFDQNGFLPDRSKIRHADKGPFRLCAHVDQYRVGLAGQLVESFL